MRREARPPAARDLSPRSSFSRLTAGPSAASAPPASRAPRASGRTSWRSACSKPWPGGRDRASRPRGGTLALPPPAPHGGRGGAVDSADAVDAEAFERLGRAAQALLGSLDGGLEFARGTAAYAYLGERIARGWALALVF